MKTLSIVIPSYNTAKFIDKNLLSFIDERILNEIEILIINDGSVDDTEKIAKSWEMKYPDTIRVITKSNGGHGSAINYGIEIATGKYFKVVDGDDWVDTKKLIMLVDYLKKTNTDLVINPYYLFNERTKKYRKRGVFSVITGQEYILESILKNISYISLHMWTIKTTILKENNIAMTEKCYYEDFEYVIFPILYVKTVVFLDFPVYVYLIGQQNQSVSNKNVLKNENMHWQIIRDSIEFIEYRNREISKNSKKYIYTNIENLIKSHYNIFLRNYKEKNIYEKMCKFDEQLNSTYPLIYQGVLEKHKYIRYIKINKIIFYIEAILFKALRNMRGCD